MFQYFSIAFSQYLRVNLELHLHVSGELDYTCRLGLVFGQGQQSNIVRVTLAWCSPKKSITKSLRWSGLLAVFERSISFTYGTSTVCYLAVLLKEGRYLAWVGFCRGIESYPLAHEVYSWPIIGLTLSSFFANVNYLSPIQSLIVQEHFVKPKLS